jgi:hypothetical protein
VLVYKDQQWGEQMPGLNDKVIAFVAHAYLLLHSERANPQDGHHEEPQAHGPAAEPPAHSDREPAREKAPR